MQPMNTNRSYSEFFTSGFRAMINRPRRMFSTRSTTPVMTSDSTATTSSTRRRSPGNITNRRSQTTSMIISPSNSINSETSSRTRRSSLVTFSSWLFERKPGKLPDDYLSFSNLPPKNGKEIFGTGEITEVWITAGGPYTPFNISKSKEETCLFQTIDPFASSPDSKSFFIDLAESPPPPTTPKRESFLSLTGSSPDRSFLHLPIPRRERPTSVQTMPLPSRRSSHHSCHYRPQSRNISWSVEEERIATSEPLVGDSPEWPDPAHDMDWRQFHIELLLDEA